jgi:hypothetical protein
MPPRCQIGAHCSYASHENNICDLPRFDLKGSATTDTTWGVTPRRDTPSAVKLVGFQPADGGRGITVGLNP